MTKEQRGMLYVCDVRAIKVAGWYRFRWSKCMFQHEHAFVASYARCLFVIFSLEALADVLLKKICQTL